MKIQRTTLVLMLLAILLGGFVYFYEIRWTSETIILERSPESGATKWLMKSPDAVPANDGTVAYLLDLLEKEESERTLTIPASQLSQFGLQQPQATIDITLNNQKTHKLVVGKLNFDNRLVYAQIQDFSNKPNENVEVVLVSKNFENAIKRSLSEWKAVDNNKTTPSPTATATPTNSTPTPTPATPTIKPIPINPTPKPILTNPTPNQ